MDRRLAHQGARRPAVPAGWAVALVAALSWLGAVGSARAQEGSGTGQADVVATGSDEAGAAEEGSGEGSEAEGEEATVLTPVTVGVYVNRLLEVDLPDHSFSVDFWIWFRWQGDAVDPLSTFEIVGGQIDSRASEIHDVIHGIHYATERVVAHIQHFYNVARFPLDNHRLSIAVEDAEHETDEIVYVPDIESCAIDPEARAPGWDLRAGGAEVETHVYHTNYGDISLPSNVESEYSRFLFHLELTRPGMGYFWKLFWSSFLATLIGLLSLYIRPTDLDARFGLGVGALFASVASAYVITSALPETSQVTLAEQLSILSVGFIFLALIVSIASLRLCYAERGTAAWRLDRWAFRILLTIYLVANGIALGMAW